MPTTVDFGFCVSIGQPGDSTQPSNSEIFTSTNACMERVQHHLDGTFNYSGKDNLGRWEPEEDPLLYRAFGGQCAAAR